MRPPALWGLRFAALWIGGMLLSCGLRSAAESAPAPEGVTAETIVRQLLERAEAATNAASGPAVGFRRITIIEELDSRGRLCDRKTKEHAVVLRGTDQVITLVRMNGETPSDSDQRRETRREKGHREKFAPRREDPSQPLHRIGRDLLERFEYRLLGCEMVGDRLAYLLSFEPGTPPQGGKIADRVLGGLCGHLWVDAGEFEPVRIQARLNSPVSIGGFLAVLDEFRMDVERQRLPSGVWVDQRVDTHVGGRKLVQRFHGHFEVTQDQFALLPEETAAGRGTAGLAGP